MSVFDGLTKQYNDVLSVQVDQLGQLVKRFENQLFREEADADRLVTIEEIGQAAANGSISLTGKISQPTLITGILVTIDANTAVTLTIGRYSQVIKNTQLSQNLIAPVQYVIGPGDILKVSWISTPTAIPYFAVFGKLVGSHYG